MHYQIFLTKSMHLYYYYCHLQVKRFLSINSGTSRNSSSASLSSTERPVVKRFAKSNSTETEKSAEAGENTPLLPLGGHSQNSGDHQSGCRAEATCVSKGKSSQYIAFIQDIRS